MKKIFLIAISLMMTACAPYLDARKEAGQISTVGQSRADSPAVCYNPLWTDQAQVDALANQECRKQNKQAVFREKTYFSCSLFNPNTAFYECQK